LSVPCKLFHNLMILGGVVCWNYYNVCITDVFPVDFHIQIYIHNGKLLSSGSATWYVYSGLHVEKIYYLICQNRLLKPNVVICHWFPLFGMLQVPIVTWCPQKCSLHLVFIHLSSEKQSHHRGENVFSFPVFLYMLSCCKSKSSILDVWDIFKAS